MDVRVQLVDGMFLTFTVSKTLERSASVHLLFAFEYIIQASVLASTAIKYGLSLIDNHFEGRWENKVSMPDEFCLYANACANLSHSVITLLCLYYHAGGVCLLFAAPDRHAAPLCVCGVFRHCLHQLWAPSPPGMPRINCCAGNASAFWHLTL